LGAAYEENFKLDTKNFNTLINSSKNLADTMKNLKSNLDASKNSLISIWIGKGSNSFQKKYQQLMRQLTDLTDDLYAISDKIASDYEAYMLWDTKNSQSQAGATNRY